MKRPDNYPLPWCYERGEAFWQINFRWCLTIDGWAAFQKDKPMAELIPIICRILKLNEPQEQKSEA